MAAEVRENSSTFASGEAVDTVLSQDDMTLWLKSHTAADRNRLTFFAETTNGEENSFSSLADLVALYAQLVTLDMADGFDGIIAHLPDELHLALPANATMFEHIAPSKNGTFMAISRLADGHRYVGTAWVYGRERIARGWKYYVATNAHIADDLEAQEKDRYFIDHRGAIITNFKIEGLHRDWDIALMSFESGEDYPVLPLGDEKNVRMGDDIVVMGNQRGNGIRYFPGFVSTSTDYFESLGNFPSIQFNSDGGPGTSGSPLFNKRGEVIGMAASGLFSAKTRVRFSNGIPISLVDKTCRQILKDGAPHHSAYLDAEYNFIPPDVLHALGFKETSALYITQIIPGSRAERAGLNTGDILLSYDGKSIPGERELKKMEFEISQAPYGSQAAFVRTRLEDTKKRETIFYAAEKVVQQPLAKYQTPYDFTVTELSEAARSELAAAWKMNPADVPGVEIVAVTNFDETKEVNERLLYPGAVLTGVNGQTVRKPADLRQLLETTESTLPMFNVADTVRIPGNVLRSGISGRRWLAFAHPLEQDDRKKQDDLGLTYVELGDKEKKRLDLSSKHHAYYVVESRRSTLPSLDVIYPGDILIGYNNGPLEKVKFPIPIVGPLMGDQHQALDAFLEKPWCLPLDLEMVRNGEIKHATRSTCRFPADGLSSKATPSPFDFDAIELTTADREKLELQETSGVYVRIGGAQPYNHPYGLENGMVIISLDGQPVASPTELKKALTEIRRRKKAAVLEVAGSTHWRGPGYRQLIYVPAHL
ncbi:MAG: trypsin-like peptidase domain-containing protein [Deltaproteobacteria bacterium]|nr:trypsin-like peptidase domain-containing protein [Deltaproteobacteria bacterium]